MPLARVLDKVVGCGVAVGLTREYIFIQFYYTFDSAQLYCRLYYRDLATITSNEENKRLLQSRPGYYVSWIGMYMPLNTWTWSDGDPSLFRKWNLQSSSYIRKNEYCAFIYDTEFWFNKPCEDMETFYCYRFLILVKEKKTWEEAQEFCRTNYTGLASVTSKLSLRQLNLETVGTETESIWTGLHFMDGQWFCVSREQLVSMPSCPAQSYRCEALNTTTNTLKNQNCNERLNFVCYWVF
ncbi:hypothetical protein QTP70_021682 [Hemibagrus guttatus]|uniref:C-type lectin domain-containing protein n=1 Tax=Hemibagrus guttatus TaxID=175788 RepID=A0AAE0RD42_9TELE|nr:hypothetical protein QTP70_021682 [Hemibagrus guttatus]